MPPSLAAGAVLVGLVILTALVSFAWTPGSPTHVVIADRFAGPGQRGHLLGSDQFGRDVLSMLMVGARNTLLVGVVAVGIAVALGVPLGGLAALRRGWLEELVMRTGDLLLAFPALLLAILFAAVFRPGIVTAMVAIGIAFTPVFARLVRGSGLQVMAQDYVTAARTFGSSSPAIFWRHLLPNVANVLIVQATVAFALAILAEAALSYLGLGTQPPTPSWGRMLNDAQAYLGQSPLLALWPGLAIALAVLGFNLLGDGLRDLLDPRLRLREPEARAGLHG
ncbi:MAG TPA: ABC transporter permease [Candidatus Dormibacteraeota bacterium]|nr:ABC transporter permease [Candidatus Dormibacteraeota bacterium]